MRVLVNTLELSPSGGIELHALQVSRELASRGHVIDVVAQRDGVSRSEYETFANTVSVFGDFLHGPLSVEQLRHPGTLVEWVRRVGYAVRSSRRLHPDVIYANDQQSLMWACATSRRPRVPIVCHLHGGVGRPFGVQRTILARRVATFIAPSGFIRDDWVGHGVPASWVEVIPQGVDPNVYPRATSESRNSARRILGFPHEAFVAVFVGRIVPDKGIDVLIRAWERIGLPPERGRLLIVGRPWPWSYLKYLRDIAPPTCLFMDMQTDVIPILHAADVLVLPSLCEEAFGRVIIEAMATGCPAVASNVGGIPEVLTGRFASMLFERGNEEELAARLSELQTWRRDEPELADACVAHVTGLFNLASAVDRIEQVLESSQAYGWRTGPSQRVGVPGLD